MKLESEISLESEIGKWNYFEESKITFHLETEIRIRSWESEIGK